jgi:PEP-CTERM motif
VIAADASNVLRFDSTGAIVKTYTIPSASLLFALNLDPDGVTAWTGDLSTNMVTRFNIGTGAIVSQWSAGAGTLAGLTVFGEITQGGGGGSTTPEPGTFVLLGISGATLALARRRRFKTRN